MKPAQWSLRLRVALFFALLALGGVLAIALGLWVGHQRLALPGSAGAFVQAGLVAGAVVVGIVTWIGLLFDTHVARAVERLAAALRARAHAALDEDLDRSHARYLGDLAPAAAEVSRRLARTRSALAESVARETARLSAEKARLEKLLADVPVAVLLCTAEHQLVFYNGQAVDLLGVAHAPGLDRNLLDFVREGPVAHAWQRLVEAGDADASADLLCATHGGSHLLAGRMRLLEAVREDAPAPGYVLTLRDVTADMAAHASREAVLGEVFDRVRRPAANLLSALAVLEQAPHMPRAEALRAALRTQVRALTTAILDVGNRYDALRSDWRPLAHTRSDDLLDSARARFDGLGLSLDTQGPDLILHCDGYQTVSFFAALAHHVAGRGHGGGFVLRLEEEDGPGALLSLAWQGPSLPMGELEDWLDTRLDPRESDLTGRAVLATHGTEAWSEHPNDGWSLVRVPVRHARRAGHRPPPVPRGVVYDFELLSKARNAAVADTPLEDLVYVVFDTETTGLTPSTDEIVQIAAVRLVNGRRVEGEAFETLVDPERPIPATATDIHGITRAMVTGAPTIAEAGARFHRFAHGAVLVAHNAPFDLEFLRRHEDRIGARFDNPILDTVLLSAVVFGQDEEHSLDALAHRLGITIPEEDRHTAMGDTLATADAFLKLVPMLRARGLATFGDVLAEVRRHGRLLRDANSGDAHR